MRISAFRKSEPNRFSLGMLACFGVTSVEAAASNDVGVAAKIGRNRAFRSVTFGARPAHRVNLR